MKTFTCLCLFSLLFSVQSAVNVRLPRSTGAASINADWLHLISDYVRGASNIDGESSNKHGGVRRIPLPILILPVPIPVHFKGIDGEKNKQVKGDAKIDIRAFYGENDEEDAERRNSFESNYKQQAVVTHKETSLKDEQLHFGDRKNVHDRYQSGQFVKGTPLRPAHRDGDNDKLPGIDGERIKQVKGNYKIDVHTFDGENAEEDAERRNYHESNNRQHAVVTHKETSLKDDQLHFGDRKNVNDRYQSGQFVKGTPTRPAHRDGYQDKPPEMPIPVSSKELLYQFHKQFSLLQGQDLPPAVIDKDALEVTYTGSASAEEEDFQQFHEDTSRHKYNGKTEKSVYGFGTQQQTSPPTPIWNYSVTMRAELHLPRADYTEPYQMWYDANSGNSRVDFHEGGSSTYRMVAPDGRVHRVARRTNRLGEANIPECLVDKSHIAREEMTTPGLPDMTHYQFNGYDESAPFRHEKWTRLVQGRPGELGASPQETMTFHHEVLVKRSAGTTMPVSYSVKVDSSILGPSCDEYVHRYLDVQPIGQYVDPTIFQLNIDAECDRKHDVEPNNPTHLSHLEPLREFTLSGRDQRYDVEIDTYKATFERSYADPTEEAIRKNLYVQHNRFILSANRESATFELEMNFLGDRLDAELQQLLGVRWEDADLVPASLGPEGRAVDNIEEFPHPEPALRKLSRKLPKKFDWRPRGAVTPVKFQDSCPSCWAFAVTGAVEGALFIRRRQLVPLSEQCLVDCARPFGGNGCGGTWPRFAYNYVKARGLPASDDYGPYKKKEEQCRERQTSPVTHISAYVNVTQHSVPALKVAIRKYAPSVVIVDGMCKSFVFYKKGVLYDDRCGKTLRKLNHAVLAVGWGEHRRVPHFILKNSWSTGWGEEGYAKVQGPANTCGVLEQPSYPRLEDSDVDRLPAAAATDPQPSEDGLD